MADQDPVAPEGETPAQLQDRLSPVTEADILPGPEWCGGVDDGDQPGEDDQR